MRRFSRSQIFRKVLLLCLLATPALAQDVDVEKKFAPVPGNVRARLLERLNQFLEYDRTAQYEKKYDLFSDNFLTTLKWKKEDYVKLMQEREAKGKSEKLLDFKVSRVEKLSLDDSLEHTTFKIYGRLKYLKGKKTKSEERLLDASYQNGDWYFSDWLIEYINY
jgi:hypothetical protein